MKIGIRTRLSISFALIFTVLIALFSTVIYYLMISDHERKLAEDTRHDMGEILLVFANGSWKDQLAELAEESREFGVLIRVLDPDGGLVSLTPGVRPPSWPVDPVILERARTGSAWSNEEIAGMPHLVLTRQFRPVGGLRPHFVQIANSREHVLWIRDLLIACINLGTPLILVIALFAGRMFARRALAPVERIRSRAQSINSRRLDERLVYDGPRDELFRLTETLNTLLDEIERSMKQTKQFVADASHELRIPLTGLRGTIEVALRRSRTTDDYRKTLETIQVEAERLSELVSELLSLAQMDAGELKLEKTAVDVGRFMMDVLETARTMGEESRLTVKAGTMAVGTASFDEARLHQVMLNLVENAVHYNRPGGEVVLSSSLGDRFVVTVTDSGIGISADDLPKIFDRFYRVGESRSPGVSGTGLGLAISRAIVEAHGGTLTARSVPSRGSEFTLSIPVS